MQAPATFSALTSRPPSPYEHVLTPPGGAQEVGGDGPQLCDDVDGALGLHCGQVKQLQDLGGGGRG